MINFVDRSAAYQFISINMNGSGVLNSNELLCNAWLILQLSKVLRYFKTGNFSDGVKIAKILLAKESLYLNSPLFLKLSIYMGYVSSSGNHP